MLHHSAPMQLVLTTQDSSFQRPLCPVMQEEPSVLPSRVPALLVNGSSGIAVGIATKIPPHNLQEVVHALGALIKDPNITVAQLMQHIPGPDFPTGGTSDWRRPGSACYLSMH